jgi:hypothetical protein
MPSRPSAPVAYRRCIRASFRRLRRGVRSGLGGEGAERPGGGCSRTERERERCTRGSPVIAVLHAPHYARSCARVRVMPPDKKQRRDGGVGRQRAAVALARERERERVSERGGAVGIGMGADACADSSIISSVRSNCSSPALRSPFFFHLHLFCPSLRRFPKVLLARGLGRSLHSPSLMPSTKLRVSFMGLDQPMDSIKVTPNFDDGYLCRRSKAIC